MILKKKQIGGVVFLAPLVTAIKIAVQLLLLKKPFGLINPFSLTFFTITIPVILIILSIHNKKIKKLIKEYLNIDIYKVNSYFNKESLRELIVVYSSYFILSQIFFVTILNPSKRRIMRGKFTSIGLLDIPRTMFDIFSLIIVPRMANNFIEKNVQFQFEKNMKIASQIFYYTAILGIIGLNNIWNYTNLSVASLFTFILIILLENDFNLYFPGFDFKKKKIFLNKIKFKKMFYQLFGYEFPNKKYKLDYVKVCFFLGIFCFILISTYSKYIPFYDDLIGSELHVLEVIAKIFLCIVLPIKLKNLAKGKRYETEMFLFGNLLSIFIPIFFREIIEYFYSGVDMVSDVIDDVDLDLGDY